MEVGIYLLKSVAVLSLFYGVYLLFLRKETLFHTKRHFFLAGIIAALVVPFIQFTNTVIIEVPATELTALIPQTQNTLVNSIPTETNATIDYGFWAMLLYTLGALIMAFKFSRELFSLLYLIKGRPASSIGQYTFVQVDDMIAPFSFFRFIVYNPKLHTEQELEMILKHEQVHASQWHSVDIVIGNLIRILQWVNPCSWFYKKSLEENLEFIADNETVNQVPSKKEYQLTLVRASSPLLAPALTTQFYQSFIKKRIVMLNKQTSNKRNSWKAALVLPLLGLFLWSFNVQEVVEFKTPEVVETPVEPPEPIEVVAMKAKVPDPVEPAALAGTPPAPLSPDTPDAIEEGAIAKPAMISPPAAVLAQSLPKNQKSGTLWSGDFKFKITKNTSDAELEKMKTELKKQHGIDMSYSVVRNSSKEITAISLSYTGNGNSGSYNIEDDHPIEDFHFFMSDGRSGFHSEGGEKRHMERMAKRMAEMERRNAEREERLAKRMYERSEEIDRRREEMGKRRELGEEEREELMEQEKKLAKKYRDQARAINERNREIKKRNKEIERIKKGKGNNTFVYSDDFDFEFGFDDAVVIDQNTSDAELEEMKDELAQRGVVFNYSKLKRNANGEIVRIKVTSEDRKGNRSTVVSSGEEDEPIEKIIIKN